MRNAIFDAYRLHTVYAKAFSGQSRRRSRGSGGLVALNHDNGM